MNPHSPILFYNTIYSNLSFDDVYGIMLNYVKQAPYHEYRLSIGSDSQVTKETTVVTAIHLHRVGRGAIGFITKKIIPRPIHNLREKIFYETSKTLEIATLFTSEKLDGFFECILYNKNKTGDIHFEFHLDVGTSGATRHLIKEMVCMANGTAFEPKIKPDSYAASSYANRYTKH